jgi:uncharacterized Zn-finger protein
VKVTEFTLIYFLPQKSQEEETHEEASAPPTTDSDPNKSSGEMLTSIPEETTPSSTQMESVLTLQYHTHQFEPSEQQLPPPTHHQYQYQSQENSSNNVTSSQPSSSEPAVVDMSEVNLIHESTEGTRKSMQIKVRKIGVDKWHLCPIHNCPKTFKKPSDLIRHVRVHTQERPYTCHVCGKSFAVKSTLSTHLKTHSDVKEWECRVCRKQFSVVTSLRAHERLHTGAKPFSCSQCPKTFRTSSQRRMHLRVHNRSSTTQGLRRVKLLRIGDTSSSSTNASKVDLPDPLKITSEGDLVPVPNRTSQSLLKGVGVSSDPAFAPAEWTKARPYRCTQCPSAFKKSSHLKQHLRSHSGERPYKCFQCFRSFISSGVLKNHIKTHEGVRSHKCPDCQLTFTTNGSLKRHMVSIHSELRAFVCPHCHKTFKTSVQCRKHIKTHRSELVELQSRHETSQLQLQQQRSNNKEGLLVQNNINQQNEKSNLGSSSEHQFDNNPFLDIVAGIHQQQQQHQLSKQVNSSTSPEELIGSVSVLHHHQGESEESSFQMQQQIQDITELIESQQLAGEIVTQYALHTGQHPGDDGSHHHQMSISLGDGQTFDGSIFTLHV